MIRNTLLGLLASVNILLAVVILYLGIFVPVKPARHECPVVSYPATVTIIERIGV